MNGNGYNQLIYRQMGGFS